MIDAKPSRPSPRSLSRLTDMPPLKPPAPQNILFILSDDHNAPCLGALRRRLYFHAKSR